MVHARLDDRRLMLRPKAQQRQGRADVVVEIGLGLEGAEAPPQHTGDHLLGGGLSGRAGDLHHRQVKFSAIPACQRLQRQPGVLHLNIEFPRQQHLRRLRRQAARRAGLQRFANVGVSVEPLSHQRHEQRSRRNAAAVGGHLGDGSIAALQQHAAHSSAYLPYRAGRHARSAFLAARDSSTILSHSSP